MTVLLTDAVMAVTETLERIRADLKAADVYALSRTIPTRESSAKTKSWSYVWMAGAVEQFVKDVIYAVLTEINSQQVPRSKLRKSLFALILSPDLESLKTASKTRAWRQRSAMFAALDHTHSALFNLDVRPLDGRTITADHFECIWEVFGFDPPHIPQLRHKLALKDLAEGRNKIAHGHVDPVAFGRNKASPDLIRLADLIEETVMHLWDRADDYLKYNRYIV